MRLRPARAARIVAGVLGIDPPPTPKSAGSTFACHKTTGVDGAAGMEHSHCAGALIFSEKHQNPGAVLQIAQRLGLYDPRQLQGHDRVFDNLKEMLEKQV